MHSLEGKEVSVMPHTLQGVRNFGACVAADTRDAGRRQRAGRRHADSDIGVGPVSLRLQHQQHLDQRPLRSRHHRALGCGRGNHGRAKSDGSDRASSPPTTPSSASCRFWKTPALSAPLHRADSRSTARWLPEAPASTANLNPPGTNQINTLRGAHAGACHAGTRQSRGFRRADRLRHLRGTS